MNFASLRDRLPSALIALALQAGLLAMLLLSFEIVRQLPVEKESILILPPLAKPLPPPMTIDARGRGRPAPAAPPVLRGTGTLTPAAPPVLATPPALAAPAAPGNAKPAAPALPGQGQSDETEALLHPDKHVKDEAKFQAEMEQKNKDNGVGPGVGFIIQDPLCKLALVLLGGGFYCGAPAAHHDATDAQVKAALDAYHQRRGGGPPPAPAPATPPAPAPDAQSGAAP